MNRKEMPLCFEGTERESHCALEEHKENGFVTFALYKKRIKLKVKPLDSSERARE
jgi:hypothetical protein